MYQPQSSIQRVSTPERIARNEVDRIIENSIRQAEEKEANRLVELFMKRAKEQAKGLSAQSTIP